jgi:hypothetical protein
VTFHVKNRAAAVSAVEQYVTMCRAALEKMSQAERDAFLHSLEGDDGTVHGLLTTCLAVIGYAHVTGLDRMGD